MKYDKGIIKLLKSGNFTFIYTDNGSCNLYEGKWKKWWTEKEGEAMEDSLIAEFDCQFNGYCPDEVAYLTQALGGLSDSN